MAAVWWSCVLGLLCRVTEITAAATQTPSSISVRSLNSSITFTCSVSCPQTLALSFRRRFDPQDVLFLSLKNRQIARNNPAPGVKGRIEAKAETGGGSGLSGGPGLSVTISLSQLQIQDTDLYFCFWSCFKDELQTYGTNGSIVIVKEYIPDRVDPQCEGEIFDLVSLALSITSVPLVLCLFILSVFALCKRFTKKFTPGGSSLPAPPHRPRHVCPPPQSPTYSYLSSSVSSSFSH